MLRSATAAVAGVLLATALCWAAVALVLWRCWDNGYPHAAIGLLGAYAAAEALFTVRGQGMVALPLLKGRVEVCATWCSLQDEAAGLWLTSLVQSNKLGGLLCATGPSLLRLVTGAPFFPGQADTGLSLAMTRRWPGSASTTASTRSHSRTRQAHTATSSTPGV